MGGMPPMVTHELARCLACRGRGLCELHQFASRLDKPLTPSSIMKKKPTIVHSRQDEQPYIMRIADLLSDDPILVSVIGPHFKVIAHADHERKRVTYSFRCVDDTEPDEWDVKQV